MPDNLREQIIKFLGVSGSTSTYSQPVITHLYYISCPSDVLRRLGMKPMERRVKSDAKSPSAHRANEP